jgi:glycosyltransferase involved in cell wall biosynthesis
MSDSLSNFRPENENITSDLPRFLVALPVYNEASHVTGVLDEVIRYAENVLAVDDGSTDGTTDVLRKRKDCYIVHHEKNRGYGAGLKSAFQFAIDHGYEYLVTIDCDGQHQPRLIPEFIRAITGKPTLELPFKVNCLNDTRPIDTISGSRYLKAFDGDTIPPVERRRINVQITEELNACFGLNLTDAFCGFKAYRVASLENITITDNGYAMPLEFWVRAAHAKMRVEELPVPLIYLEEKRSFGGALDDAQKRLAYYHEIIDRTLTELTGKPAGVKLNENCCNDGSSKVCP